MHTRDSLSDVSDELSQVCKFCMHQRLKVRIRHVLFSMCEYWLAWSCCIMILVLQHQHCMMALTYFPCFVEYNNLYLSRTFLCEISCYIIHVYIMTLLKQWCLLIFTYLTFSCWFQLPIWFSNGCICILLSFIRGQSNLRVFHLSREGYKMGGGWVEGLHLFFSKTI